MLGAEAIAGQVTMAVGPPLGGLLIAVWGWRLTFLVARSWHELDPPGRVLFAAALTGLLPFLMSLASPRWWLLGAPPPCWPR